MNAASRSRRSGLLVPLFTCPSSTSWGIGDIHDLHVITGWLAAAGQRILQLLPLNEMASGQQSPYSAISAMAIDPIFIAVGDVPEFAAIGGEATLDSAERVALERVRQAPAVDHATVRILKQRALTRAFDRFREAEWRHHTARAESLRRFLVEEASWMNDYALFRALHEREEHRPWTEWPEALRRREPDALEAARRELSSEILFYQYLQWIADAQWKAARQAAHGVAIFGDLPFMVDGDSADVWSRQEEFQLDASVGVPPDAFSPTGQDWGMPAYRWDVIASGGFRWLRERARRSAALFDGYRVDHVVGFYRTYSRSRDGGAPSFSPATEPEQLALGEQVLRIFREPGSEIVAEDLGTVPDFVRESLTRLDVPGCRVFRWERYWHDEGQPFRDPAHYPRLSVAVSGTHDTEPLAVWWEQASADDRQQISALPTVQEFERGVDLAGEPFNPIVRDALLESLFASGSDVLLMPIQDVFGWTTRINEPGTVGPANWTFRLPWPSDQMAREPEAVARQHALRNWAARHGR